MKKQIEWLKNLQVNDKVKVVMHRALNTSIVECAEVTKITATQIVVGKQRFSKKTGKEVCAGIVTPISQCFWCLEKWSDSPNDAV